MSRTLRPAAFALTGVCIFALALGHDVPVAAQVRPSAIVSALGRCLDVSSANSGNGAAIQLYDCNGTPAQQWFVEGSRIRSALGRCLDVSAANSGNGASLQLYDCNGTPAQTWTVPRTGPIVSALGRCLDVSSANSGNGASLQLYDCNGTPAQTWTLR